MEKLKVPVTIKPVIVGLDDLVAEVGEIVGLLNEALDGLEKLRGRELEIAYETEPTRTA